MLKRVFDNDRNMYALSNLQLDVVVDGVTSPNSSLGTGTRSFKTVGKGGFGSIYVGTIQKRTELVSQGDAHLWVLGYYHDALMAIHSSNKHAIALKELEGSITSIKVAVKRIEAVAQYEHIREASSLRILWGRRNFVTIYGPTMSRDLKCVCLVMDFVQGCNLNEFLRSRGTAVFKLDWNDERARMCKLWESNEVLWWMEKLKLFREIVIALVVCHSQKVYHGDLKGANILLDKTLVPKIVDFGLSFRRADISYIREVGGSLFWAAPEVVDPPEGGTIHESEVVSDPYPSDIYSLGMVLAEMMLDGEVKDSFTDVELFICDKLDGGCPVSLDHVSSPDAMFNKRVLNRLKSLINCCCEAERADRMPLQKCLSEVNAVFSELHSFCSPKECSILYGNTDHDFTDSGAYTDMVLRFKERFPSVLDCVIYSPFWNMVVDEEENLLVHYFCKLDYVEGVKYVVEQSAWDFQPDRDIPYMSLLCVTEESLQTLRYLSASWPDAMKRQILLLHKACFCNNSEVFRFLLLDVGINFDTWEVYSDRPGQGRDDRVLVMKPIHKLAAKGKTEMVRMILDNCEVDPAYINTTVVPLSRETPLYYATVSGDNVETIAFLLKRGANLPMDPVTWEGGNLRPDWYSWRGREKLLDVLYGIAREEGDTKMMKFLSDLDDSFFEMVPARDDLESSPRNLEDIYAELEIAKMYAHKILSAFETGSSEEVISLHFQIEFPFVLAKQCCEKGYLGILQFLEDCGLDLNSLKEQQGNSAYFQGLLHEAAECSHVNVAKFLVEEREYAVNPIVNFSAFSESPLQRACGSGTSMHKKEMVAFLLNAGADPNHKDSLGYTSMERVCGSFRNDKGSRELVRLLLEAGFDCGQRDPLGEDYLDFISRLGEDFTVDSDSEVFIDMEL